MTRSIDMAKRLQGVPDIEVLEIDIVAPFGPDLNQVTYKMITKDYNGNVLRDPYIGIKASDPMQWVDSRIMDETVKKILTSWSKFSGIQCATWIKWDQESIKRFLLWRKSGNDEDAWT